MRPSGYTEAIVCIVPRSVRNIPIHSYKAIYHLQYVSATFEVRLAEDLGPARPLDITGLQWHSRRGHETHLSRVVADLCNGRPRRFGDWYRDGERTCRFFLDNHSGDELPLVERSRSIARSLGGKPRWIETINEHCPFVSESVEWDQVAPP
jgi:hypothetical protein